ncbi:MAG: hypothetical protein K2P64_04140 [Lachnospiraceae bacterium]|nr:hypothetical protein [Lachnospiraceae bacterium]
MMRDLEYMQQLYPADAKKYQKKIATALDAIDYEGSMLYDEYPCRWQMHRLCQSVVAVLRRESQDKKEEISAEKWAWIEEMVQILLYYEVYKRRHTNKNRIKPVELFEKYR